MKIVRIILWIIICMFFLLGLLYLFTGALEWFTTPRQEEIARIISAVMIVIPVVCGIVLVSIRKK